MPNGPSPSAIASTTSSARSCAHFPGTTKYLHPEFDFENQTAAAQVLSRLCELEPFDGDAQRRLLSLLIVLDRRSEAVRRYRQLRVGWIDAFGEPPAFDIRSLSLPAGDEPPAPGA